MRQRNSYNICGGGFISKRQQILCSIAFLNLYLGARRMSNQLSFRIIKQ